MIDVVFLLLIFFTCTTKWKASEGNLAAELPSQGATTESPAPIDLEKIVIKLKRADGSVDVRMNERLCPSFAFLYEQLRSLRDKADIPVIIDAERDVLVRDVIAALNVALKAAFTNVSFAAPLSPPPGG